MGEQSYNLDSLSKLVDTPGTTYQFRATKMCHIDAFIKKMPPTKALQNHF